MYVCKEVLLLNLIYNIFFQEYLQGCLHLLEDMVTATVNSQDVNCNGGLQGNGCTSVNSRSTLDHSSTLSGGTEKIAEYGKAGTPTDVRDIHFWLDIVTGLWSCRRASHSQCNTEWKMANLSFHVCQPKCSWMLSRIQIVPTQTRLCVSTTIDRVIEDKVKWHTVTDGH